MIITIIPAKPFAESKKRLAPVLSHRERVLLSQNLLQHTIVVARSIGPVVVVSRSATVRNFAAGMGANMLPEKNRDLNDAVCQGINWAQVHGASSVLILPLDLPLLTTAILEKLVEPGYQPSPSIVIAPCRHRQGTNALVLTPPNLMAPQFGSYSFARHRECAQNAGINPTIYHSPQLAFDLDTPQDWLELTALGAQEKWPPEAFPLIQTSKL